MCMQVLCLGRWREGVSAVAIWILFSLAYLVVFEELYLITDMDGDGTAETETKAAEHRDITDEGQTVLLKAPEEESEEEPKTEEPEEEPQHEPTPEKPMEVPKTGDSTPLGLWILLLVGTAVMTVTFYRRRG